jgi:hypothetical protein
MQIDAKREERPHIFDKLDLLREQIRLLNTERIQIEKSLKRAPPSESYLY